MTDSGALVSIMSGSGNAVFGLFDGSAKHATDNLKKINEELFIFDIRL